jgi:hypothetical protein
MMSNTSGARVAPSYSVAAYRGLWDRRAAPNSIGAFRRACIKGVPFVVDLTTGAIDHRELISEGLFGQSTVHVFLKAETLDTAHEILDGASLSKNIHVVASNAKNGDLLPVFCRDTGVSFSHCGFYLPLGSPNEEPISAQGRLTPAESEQTRMVLHESIDIVQDIAEMRMYSHDRDTAVRSFLVGLFGDDKHYVKVSDLVEREFLISQIEG